ncbi:MAG: hypothetical protein LBE35_02110 [Clostridiales bacterium]|jgi:hypothetical protein|nr:hypothetical protein [Clostridiales bacterium]
MDTLKALKEDLAAFLDERYSANPKVQDIDEAYKVAAVLLATDSSPLVPNVGKFASEALPATFEDYADLIEADIEDAARFSAWFKQTSQEQWKQIAKYRAASAGYFIEKAKEHAQNPSHQQQLKDRRNELEQLNTQLPK